MNGGIVQNLLRFRHAQEAGTLLKGFGTELGHFFDLRTVGKNAVFLPVFYHVAGRCFCQPGNALQQACGGRVHIDADSIHTVFHNAVKRFRKLLFRHVMLILADADGHGFDLYQLRQRILEPPGDGNRRAKVYVVIREFRGAERRGGIDGSAGFVDDGVCLPALKAVEHFGGHLFRLARGGAVSDGNVFHMMFADQSSQLFDGFFLLALVESGVNYGGIQHFAGAVHHGNFAAVAVAGIQPHRHFTLDGRLHQQWAEILRKHLNGAVTGHIRQCAAALPLERGEDQAVIRIVACGAHELHGVAARSKDLSAQSLQGKVSVGLNGYFEKALLFSAVDRQNTVARDPVDALGKIVVLAVNGVFLLRLFGAQYGGGCEIVPQHRAHVGIVRNVFGNDIGSALQRIFNCKHAFLFIQIGFGGLFRNGAVGRLGVKEQGKGFEALFFGNGCSGAALLLVGAVEIFQSGKRFRLVNGGGKFLRHLSLLGNGIDDRFAALVQIAQILQAFVQGAQGGVIHGAVHLLAVSCDKGDGVALIEQLNHIVDIGLVEAELLSELEIDVHESVSFSGFDLIRFSGTVYPLSSKKSMRSKFRVDNFRQIRYNTPIHVVL